MKYIDLSYRIDGRMPVYPGDKEVSLVKERELLVDKYVAYTLSTGMHAGTHIDCPMHLLESDIAIGEYPLESFCGRGHLIDARGESEISYKAEYGERIHKGDIVLIYTGTDSYYGEECYYNEHPVISGALADFFVSRGIKMLGVDMPSPDFPPFPIHKLLLKNNIFIIENLANLEKLLDTSTFEVFAVPLKVQAEASLARVFARCP